MSITCLTIAASDSGGGAGIQADLKAFAAAGCHGASVITAITAQNTTGVQLVHALPADVVRAQIDSVFGDMNIAAVKIGVLAVAEIVATVAAAVDGLDVPVVLDPVLGASAGGSLLDSEARATLLQRLVPLSTVVTPNLEEAAALTGMSGSRAQLAEALHRLGAAAVIVTGGHGTPVDHVYDGTLHSEIAVARIEGASHGTGCTHSALLAAYLAQDMSLLDAARRAAERTAEAVAHGFSDVGAGDGPVDVLNVRG